MNAYLLQDVAFDDPTAWGAFTVNHGISHDSLDAVLRKAGHQVSFLPLYDFPRQDNQIYLLDHWQVHQSHASVLGLQFGVDLSTADFNDPEVIFDWLQLHAAVHQAENSALGLR